MCTEDVLSIHLHFLTQHLSLCVCTDLSEGAGQWLRWNTGQSCRTSSAKRLDQGWKGHSELRRIWASPWKWGQRARGLSSVGYRCPSQVRAAVEKAKRGWRAALWPIHSLKSPKIWFSLSPFRSEPLQLFCIQLILTHSPSLFQHRLTSARMVHRKCSREQKACVWHKTQETNWNY